MNYYYLFIKNTNLNQLEPIKEKINKTKGIHSYIYIDITNCLPKCIVIETLIYTDKFIYSEIINIMRTFNIEYKLLKNLSKSIVLTL